MYKLEIPKAKRLPRDAATSIQRTDERKVMIQQQREKKENRTCFSIERKIIKNRKNKR
jgi:hypothetical protein